MPRITELPEIAGGDIADDDLLLVVDASGNATRRATRAGLLQQFTGYDGAFQTYGYSKKVVANLPMTPPGYETVVSDNQYLSILPQGFCLDEVGQRMFVLCGVLDNDPSTELNGNDWVYVFDYTLPDLSDLTFNRMFGIDTGTASFSEQPVFLTQGGVDYLYVPRNGTIYRFDITALPSDQSIDLAPESTFALNGYSQMSHRNGTFLVQQSTVPVGQDNRRGYFAHYDESFTRTGITYMDAQDFGPWVNSDYERNFPKVQATCLGEGCILAASGGIFFDGGTVDPYTYQGVKLFDLNGALQSEWMIDPQYMSDTFAANGITNTRMENEGLFIMASGRVLSLYTVLSPTTPNADTNVGGIVILEEFSRSASALDMKDGARTYPRVNIQQIADMGLPRLGSDIINPITGDEFTTLNQIFDFMRAIDLRKLWFDTAGVTGIVDTAAVALEASSRYVISNRDNASFDVDVFGFRREFSFRVTNANTGSPSVFRSPAKNWGTGAPDGVIVGVKGDVYHRQDGAGNTGDFDIYVFADIADNGTANGWVRMDGVL